MNTLISYFSMPELTENPLDSHYMREEILDYFEQNGKTPEVVVFRYFTFESEAHICAARLREESIPCFISNSYMSTVLPLGGTSEVSIYIRLRDLDAAEYISKEMEALDNQALIYEEDTLPMAVPNRWMTNRWVRYFFLLLIVLLLVRAFLRAREILLWQLDSF